MNLKYRFIYSNSEAPRIVPSVLIDKRATIPAIANQVGTVIKAFVDTQVALVTNTTLFYKIETRDGGNLAGYFSLQVVQSEVVALLLYELRPAFEQFINQITHEINTFVASGDWNYDYLE